MIALTERTTPALVAWHAGRVGLAHLQHDDDGGGGAPQRDGRGGRWRRRRKHITIGHVMVRGGVAPNSSHINSTYF
jgi:hypothetical protein